MTERRVESPEEMVALGAELASQLKAGDVVLLSGELGAGKTTFVRGVLKGLGHAGDVRSPSFGILHVYDTVPPVLHADLYRLKSAAGLGIEDYLESHLCLIEWPDRAKGLVEEADCWKVEIEFESQGRDVRLWPPESVFRVQGDPHKR